MKVIITGATGMVGEGVLLECLQNEKISAVLSISRKPGNKQHPKLKELLVSDFTRLQEYEQEIKGYDACFYCAGVSSVGMKEDKYHFITYDTTIAFAKTILQANPQLSFCFVTGRGTDSTEKGRTMWARVKGKTENALVKMPFKSVYNFRPAVMLPFPGQENWKGIYKFLAKIIRFFAPASVLTLGEVGKAMIHAVMRNEPKQVLEVKDIRELAKQ